MGMAPDGSTKIEVDFIITDWNEIVQDVTLLNNFSVASYHRLVRRKILLNIRSENTKMMYKNKGKDNFVINNQKSICKTQIIAYKI